MRARDWLLVGVLAIVSTLTLYAALYYGTRPLTPVTPSHQPRAAPLRTNITVLSEMCQALPRTQDVPSRVVLAEWIIGLSDQAPAPIPHHLQACLARARAAQRI